MKLEWNTKTLSVKEPGARRKKKEKQIERIEKYSMNTSCKEGGGKDGKKKEKKKRCVWLTFYSQEARSWRGHSRIEPRPPWESSSWTQTETHKPRWRRLQLWEPASVRCGPKGICHSLEGFERMNVRGVTWWRRRVEMRKGQHKVQYEVQCKAQYTV